MKKSSKQQVMVSGWAYKTIYGICEYIETVYGADGIRHTFRHLMESGENQHYSVKPSDVWGRATSSELKMYIQQWDPFFDPKQKAIHGDIMVWFLRAVEAEKPTRQVVIQTHDAMFLYTEHGRYELFEKWLDGLVELSQHPIAKHLDQSQCVGLYIKEDAR